MAMWRTSWLAREGIALPVFMAGVFAYGVAHWLGADATRWIGAVTALLCLTLFVCTGMIYACIRFLQEWASPLTPVNYLLLGCASGATLATLLAALGAPGLVPAYAQVTILLTLLGLVTRSASLVRNARLKPKSTLQSAIGIKHPRIVQKAQGFMGGSFNTREFFHGRSVAMLRSVKWVFLILVFPVPLLFLALGVSASSPALIVCGLCTAIHRPPGRALVLFCPGQPPAEPVLPNHFVNECLHAKTPCLRRPAFKPECRRRRCPLVDRRAPSRQQCSTQAAPGAE